MGLNLGSSKKVEPKKEAPEIKPEILDEEDPGPNMTGEEADTAWIDEVMVIKQSFDLGSVNNLFSKVHEVLDDMAKQADAVKVMDKKTMETAIAMGTQAKQYANKIEKTRVKVKAPYLEYTKKLDSLANGVKKRLETIQEGLRVKIRPVMIALKEKEQAAQKAAAEAATKAVQTGSVAPPPPPETGKTTTAHGSADLVDKVSWTVVDITKVPAKYLTVAASLVNKDAKAGIDIPGIKIERTKDVAMRAAKS